MVLFKHLRDAFQGSESTELMRQRMIDWRRSQATVRVAKPMRLDRARSVGYKAKQGYVVVRQRVLRGGRQRAKIRKGRRSKHNHQHQILRKSYASVAEGRASKAFPNLTVLNSYLLSKDGRYAYFEVILLDPEHPNIKKDVSKANVARKKGRVERGLTMHGRRGRGQKAKGKGHEKNFPSLNANKGRGN